MLPLRKEFKLNLDIGDCIYKLEYLEATAEENSYFRQSVKTTSDFLVWFGTFLDTQDNISKRDCRKIMMCIYEDVESNITYIYKTLIDTMFRIYDSRYQNRRLPKEKGQGDVVGCDASTELHLAQKTLIPVHLLNKKLTLYQKQRLLDGIICDNWNMTKKGQTANKSIWQVESKVDKESDIYKARKAKIDRFKEALDRKDKKNG